MSKVNGHDLTWGGVARPDGEVTCAWGARAIQERDGFSFVGNRQGAIGDDHDVDQLMEWVNRDAVPKMRSIHWKGNSHDVITYTDEIGSRYHIRGTTNGSYGYVYLAAWKD